MTTKAAKGYTKTKHILAATLDHLKISHIPFYPIKAKVIRDSLIEFEQVASVAVYKFGVLFCSNGQTTENEMFSNRLSFSFL